MQKTPLPYIAFFIPVCILSISGLFVSLYLSISHYRVYTDIGYSSFCAISKAINCDTVSQSPYSILWGVPVPVWGVIGYAFLILLLPYLYNKKNENRKALWPVFFITALYYSLYSLYLAGISTFYIHSYCFMCIVSYGINFALLFYSWLVIKRFNHDGVAKGLIADLQFIRINIKKIIPVFSVFIFIVGWFCWTLDDYWNFRNEYSLANVPHGKTDDGHPWIGAEKPELTIIEYTDYLCFQCRKMHFFLRALVAENQEKIRLVHKHFPLDTKYNTAIKENLHSGAGEMALLAIYAGFKGRFWEMNDLLFKISRTSESIDIKNLADQTGISENELSWALNSTDIRLMLKKDIAYGLKAGVTGTPSYEIEGQTYEGTIPSEIFKKYTSVKAE